ncbi:YozE family protein [Streptococcus suis]|uniref:YozE family protein n=1 Tax=Streptococcus suis TaxID=1307 RepID=UPI0021174B9C|nr:YozE family protein [Streptococcus suis]
MRRSFYSWLMTQRNAKSNQPVAILADHVFEEYDFPKQSDDFDEVSCFLEESASFAFSMSDFDAIWEDYLAH